jgi:hypothetical protein
MAGNRATNQKRRKVLLLANDCFSDTLPALRLLLVLLEFPQSLKKVQLLELLRRKQHLWIWHAIENPVVLSYRTVGFPNQGNQWLAGNLGERQES